MSPVIHVPSWYSRGSAQAQITCSKARLAVTVNGELTDIYLLTTQSNAVALSNDPAIKAQIELSNRGILAQAAAADFFAKNAASEEEILAEYELQMKAAPPQQFKARHILVETQAAAADLIGQLGEGADFAELAKARRVRAWTAP